MKEKKKVCGCLILGKSSNLLPFGGEGHREDLKLKLFLISAHFLQNQMSQNLHHHSVKWEFSPSHAVAKGR